jgi:hypothetical protein
LESDYYKKAVDIIVQKAKLTNPTLFIFSNDHEWVKNNIKLPYNTVSINYTSEKNSQEDMILMSKCKHNVIANSSFSWWGAWLNQNPNKVITSPAKWFIKPEMQTNSIDLLPEEWIKIENKI